MGNTLGPTQQLYEVDGVYTDHKTYVRACNSARVAPHLASKPQARGVCSGDEGPVFYVNTRTQQQWAEGK